MDWIKKIISAIKGWFQGEPRFLCDTCRYDYRGACENPNRPNVTECSEYKKR